MIAQYMKNLRNTAKGMLMCGWIFSAGVLVSHAAVTCCCHRLLSHVAVTCHMGCHMLRAHAAVKAQKRQGQQW